MQQTAGEQLAMARQAMGLSLDDIAEKTRIRRDYLDAIEAMDMRDLPERAYVHGFVRTYAAEVGLDPKAILDAFIADTAPERRTVTPTPQIGLVGAARMRHWIMAGGVGLGLVIVIASSLEPPRLDTMYDVPAVPEALYAWVAAEPGSQEGIRAFAALSVSEEPTLLLRARIDTFIEVREPSGRRIFGGELRAGTTYTLPPVPGITVAADNGGGVEVIDGRDVIATLGEPGVPVTQWTVNEVRVPASQTQAQP